MEDRGSISKAAIDSEAVVSFGYLGFLRGGHGISLWLFEPEKNSGQIF